jgi:hypothetical protein
MRSPPTVGGKPRWDQGAEPEYVYLSEEGFPLYARRFTEHLPHSSPIEHVPNKSLEQSSKVTDQNEVSSWLQKKLNFQHISSSGALMREFNRPFPRFPHRASGVCNLSNGESKSSPIVDDKERARVPGILWPAPFSYVSTPLPLKTLRQAREILESSKVPGP